MGPEEREEQTPIETNSRVVYWLGSPHRQWVLWDSDLVLDTKISSAFTVVVDLVGPLLDSLWNVLE